MFLVEVSLLGLFDNPIDVETERSPPLATGKFAFEAPFS